MQILKFQLVCKFCSEIFCSTTSSNVRKISSSESEANKYKKNPNETSSSVPTPIQSRPQVNSSEGGNFYQNTHQIITSQQQVNNVAESNQRTTNFLPSTPVGMSQQQFSEMEYLTSRYLRQQQQQKQQIQLLLQQQQQQQLQQEARRSVYRSGCFDTQLNVLRKEMVRL